MSVHRRPAVHKTAAGQTVAVEPVKAAASQPGPFARFLADLRSGAAKKFIVGVAGLAASLLAADLIPSPYSHYVEAILAALTVTGIYTVRNVTSAADSEAGHGDVVSIVWLIVALVVVLILLRVFGVI